MIPDEVKAMTNGELLAAVLKALDDLAHKAFYADTIGHSEYCDIGQLVQTARAAKMLAAQPQAPQPDWSQAPDGAEWWTVGANGQSNWFLIEPYCDDSEGACWCGQFSDEGEHDMGTFGKRYAIPLGIDWRTLKQRRPEAQP